MGGILPGPKGEILLSLEVSKDGRGWMSGPFVVTEYTMSTPLNFLSEGEGTECQTGPPRAQVYKHARLESPWQFLPLAVHPPESRKGGEFSQIPLC